ncbi:hypothetical protein [Nocardioides marmoribigeumensis]|uniref:Zinc-finger domain-containing protein n=1 Tax=Nocardioides marmoribigeumensis TaxID=433649 RepID=A0ABU2BTG3_9ACTN|nr:hypothetical protein [Nocardioides marmoribigeumensis]MDR7361923.1 hypothetical protein [Nocardioides marmoribigeumensis]
MSIDVPGAWHLDAEQAEQYAAGRVGPAFAASAEQHLASCAACRALVPADPARAALVWDAVLERVEAPRVGVVERALRHLGVSHGTARLVAATPALRGAWLVAALVVLVLAVAASVADHGSARAFVALAPVLPVLGVALCFGDRTDAMLEVVTASPYSLVRLLAARTTFVVATSMVPAALVTPLLPGDRFVAVAWMVPALAMCAVVLAAARHVQPVVVATGLSAAWLVATLWASSPEDAFVAQHTGLVQLVALVALAAAAVPLTLHRHAPVAPPRRNP